MPKRAKAINFSRILNEIAEDMRKMAKEFIPSNEAASRELYLDSMAEQVRMAMDEGLIRSERGNIHVESGLVPDDILPYILIGLNRMAGKNGVARCRFFRKDDLVFDAEFNENTNTMTVFPIAPLETIRVNATLEVGEK
jgi:hypothetical protein